MVLTSEEINIIVYKYLQESGTNKHSLLKGFECKGMEKKTHFIFVLVVGFRHTSFAFQYESQVEKSTYRDAHIQPGALINIIHKGLQFMEIEAHMNEVCVHLFITHL